MNRITIAQLSSLAIAALYVIGFFLPYGLSWGIHVFAFLPTAFLLCYVACTIAGVLYCSRGNIEKPLRWIVRMMDDRAGLFLCLSCALVGIAALIFRIHVPLLGDAYTLTNNIENTINGEHPLSLGNEPLAIFYLYGVATLFVAKSFSGIMNAIFAGELVLAFGSVVVAYSIARRLFPEKGDVRKFFTMAVVLTLPTMQLFWGYPESYAVVLFLFLCTMLATFLHLEGRIPFWVVVPVFIIQVFVHYLGIILFPLFGYLAYHEWKRSGRMAIVRLALSGLPVVLAILSIVRFDITRLLPDNTHGHFLPFTQTGDQYTAYTFFSPYHVIDLLNLLFLMAPGTILLFVLSHNRLSRIRSSPHLVAMMTVVVPFLLFLLTARFDLGMAKDWDVPAAFFSVLALFSAVLFLQDGSSTYTRSMSIFLVAAILPSCAYFQLNATKEGSIRRIKTLMDDRIMPQSGIFQSAFHLSVAYFDDGNIDSMIVLWQRYTTKYPSDLRGYEKLAKSYWELGERGHDSLLQTYDRCFHLDTTNVKVRNEYADVCVYVGAARQKNGRGAAALDLYRKALNLKPQLASANNNIGLIFESQGQLDSARSYYWNALAIDSMYASAYKNMGSVYFTESRIDSAIALFQKAIRLNPRFTSAYEFLAIACQTSGNTAGAIPAYQQAARLGSFKAQHFLTQNGYTW